MHKTYLKNPTPSNKERYKAKYNEYKNTVTKPRKFPGQNTKKKITL